MSTYICILRREINLINSNKLELIELIGYQVFGQQLQRDSGELLLEFHLECCSGEAKSLKEELLEAKSATTELQAPFDRAEP